LEKLPDIDIILIEDNHFDAELTLMALQNKGLAGKVKVFPDGVEALDFLFETGIFPLKDGEGPHYRPRVIFLDLQLPKISGLEVLTRLKQDRRTCLIPVVMLTSSQEESDIFQSYQLGANSYLVKPVDYDEFSRLVGDLGRYWLQSNKTVQ